MIRNILDAHAIPFEMVTYKPGDCLYKSGDITGKVYYLAQGCVCLLQDVPGQDIRFIQTPSLISSADLFRKRHLASALVVEPSEIIEVNQHEVLQTISCDPAFLNKYLGQVCKAMSEEGLDYE